MRSPCQTCYTAPKLISGFPLVRRPAGVCLLRLWIWMIQIRAATLHCPQTLDCDLFSVGSDGPEWLMKRAQVRDVTLYCSRLLIVTFLVRGVGPEQLMKGAQVRAVTLCYYLTLYWQLWGSHQEWFFAQVNGSEWFRSELLSLIVISFLLGVSRTERLMKKAQVRDVTLHCNLNIACCLWGNQQEPLFLVRVMDLNC